MNRNAVATISHNEYKDVLLNNKCLRQFQQTFVLTKTSFVFVFRRRLQDVFIKTNIFALAIRLQKTSSRRLGQDQYIRLGHTSSRRLQDVFKTSCKNVFKTSSARLLRDVFSTFLRRTAKTVIYRRICLGHTSEKFTVSVQNLQE